PALPRRARRTADSRGGPNPAPSSTGPATRRAARPMILPLVFPVATLSWPAAVRLPATRAHCPSGAGGLGGHKPRFVTGANQKRLLPPGIPHRPRCPPDPAPAARTVIEGINARLAAADG